MLNKVNSTEFLDYSILLLNSLEHNSEDFSHIPLKLEEILIFLYSFLKEIIFNK